MMIGAALFNARQTGLDKQQAVQEKLAQLAVLSRGHQRPSDRRDRARPSESPGGLLMPNQSLLYTGRVLACSQLHDDDAHRARTVRRPDLRHARLGRVRRRRKPSRGSTSTTRSTTIGVGGPAASCWPSPATC